MATALQIVRKFFPQVESVQDATRNVTIEVSKADTQSKAVKNHEDCAMARACRRKGADGAIIAVKFSYLIQGKKAVRYMNPETVSREITAFDRNAKFEPGTYHLAKVPASSRLGHGGSHRPRTGKGRKLIENLKVHRTENIRHIGEK